MPGLPAGRVTGGAQWHDAQISSTERLLIATVLSAVQCGAVAANYVKASGFVRKASRIGGVEAVDELTGQQFEIPARVVINSAGPWVDSVIDLLGTRSACTRFRPSLAVNLVTRQVLADCAVGIYRQSSPTFFVVPWREYSLIGTMHQHVERVRDDWKPGDDLVRHFLDQINSAYPGAALSRDDVFHVHWGFLPLAHRAGPNGSVKLMREGCVHDHEREDGITGLISVVGVKYTTARHVAQIAVDLAYKKLDRSPVACRTAVTPLHGGDLESLDRFLSGALAVQADTLEPTTIAHLVHGHGSEYLRVVECSRDDPSLVEPVAHNTPVIGAEVINAVRHEMAQSLDDVVRRRTELGSAGRPDQRGVEVCADLMAAELGWDSARKEREIAEVYRAYPLRMSAASRLEAN
jgi:glycerol-3-phosphate dehydrogenase